MSCNGGRPLPPKSADSAPRAATSYGRDRHPPLSGRHISPSCRPGSRASSAALRTTVAMGLFRHQAATSSLSVGSSSPLSVLLTRLDIGHCEGDSRQLALDALGPPPRTSAS